MYWCQFHQCFTCAFFVRTSFWQLNLSRKSCRKALSYIKFALLTLMKLTAKDRQHFLVPWFKEETKALRKTEFSKFHTFAKISIIQFSKFGIFSENTGCFVSAKPFRLGFLIELSVMSWECRALEELKITVPSSDGDAFGSLQIYLRSGFCHRLGQQQ